MGDLEAMYPKFAKEIKLAREYGYSDDEIEEYFHKKISEALNAGYSAEEINEYLGVIPKTSKKKAILGAVKDTAKSLLEGIVATPEVALSMATGAIAYPLSVLGGIAKNITSGPEEARKTEEEIARTFTYAPITKTAQGTMELLGKGMEYISAPAREAGEALEKIGLPQAGYSTEKALEFLTFSILGTVLPKVGKTIRDVDIPLMKQKIETAKKAGYSETEIAKYLEENPHDIPSLETKKTTPTKKPIKKPIEKPAEKPIDEMTAKEPIPEEIKPTQPEPIKPATQEPIPLELQEKISPKETKPVTQETEAVPKIEQSGIKPAEPLTSEASKPTTEPISPEPKATTKTEPTEPLTSEMSRAITEPVLPIKPIPDNIKLLAQEAKEYKSAKEFRDKLRRYIAFRNVEKILKSDFKELFLQKVGNKYVVINEKGQALIAPASIATADQAGILAATFKKAGIKDYIDFYNKVAEESKIKYIPKLIELSERMQKELYDKAIKSGNFKGTFESFIAEFGDKKLNYKTYLPEGLELKATTKTEPTELHVGMPIDKVWQSWMAIDRGILGDFIHKTLDDTAIDRFIRRFADNEGMRYLPIKNKDNLLKAIYGTEGIKGKIGKGERITQEFLDTLSKETKKGLSDAMFIRYMEDPKYRMAFDQAYPDNPLKVIQEDIKIASENLVREGIITASQHKAWGDKYLSRVYLTLQEPSDAVGGIRKIKSPEIGKGRKIESIMDVPKQLRDELGFVEDAKTLLPLTRFKQYMPSAVNAFAKGVMEDPAMVFARDNILVKLPEGVNNAIFEGKPLNFPEYMSPYYAENVIRPAIQSLVKEGILKLPEGELKAFINEIKAKSKALKELEGNIPSDYVFMPEKEGYRNLAGLPVNKDVQNVVQSLSVIQNPAELASKLDKYVTTGLATFKLMKVPFGLTKTIMRNFLANYPQWVVSGADPIAAWKEIPKAIKDIASKSERWKEGTDAGLFKSNWFDSEILKIFDEMSKGIKDGKNPLKVWSDIMRSKPVEFVGKVYGAIDDVWRMARFNYAIDVEKLPITEAVIKANRAHYDYSLTYAIIQVMRDPSISKSPAWKILGSVFPTFSQKTLGLLYQALKDNPITTIGAISLPFIIKEMVEEQQRRKYGKKYDILSESIPDWQKDPNTVTVYDPEEKKLKIVHLDWLLPWGQWVSFFEAATKGNIKEAIQDVGGISSPLLLPSNLMRNEDIYTGKEIYDPTQPKLKQVLQILGYTGEKTIEPDFLTFLRRVYEQKKSPTEITLRSMGIPYFEYDEKDLLLIPTKKIGKLKLEINLRVNKLTNFLQRGIITEEEFAKELRRLYEYQKEEMKKIIEPLRSKKEEK